MSDPAPERFERAALQAAAIIKEELGADLAGLLVGGSVARGVAKADSDIDIFVIIHSSRRKRKNFYVEGIQVELIIAPIHKIREQFSDVDRPIALANFSTGWILYDPKGVVSALVEEARSVYGRASPETPLTMVPYVIRYGPTEVLRDIRSLGEHESETANYLIFLALQATLKSYYRLSRRWPPKPADLIRDLETHNKRIAGLVGRVLSHCGSVLDKKAALEELISSVLESAGGILDEPWETPWQELPSPNN